MDHTAAPRVGSLAELLRPPSAAVLRDVVELAKPRITAMVVFTTAMGYGFAPGSLPAARIALLVLGTALLVASANALNSWIERDADGRMVRTRHRPLPAGRLDPWSAFALAIFAAVCAVPLLALAVGPKVWDRARVREARAARASRTRYRSGGTRPVPPPRSHSGGSSSSLTT